jgi:uncharacterized membrane protein YkvA (DUF1232 family)
MKNQKDNISLMDNLKRRARLLKREACALYLAAGDPRVPWYAKAFMGLVLAYTFSPIDLIPDFVPVLGYLDDLILVPLGITLAIKMIPSQVMTDSRGRVDDLLKQGKPVIRGGVVIIIGLWLIILGLVIWWVLKNGYFGVKGSI